MARHRRAAGHRGFTLIELLVVIALIAVAAGVASLALRDGSQVQLEREAERLAALLEGARAEARSAQLPARWEPTTGVDSDGTDFRFIGLPPSPDRPSHWMADGVTVDIVGSLAVRLGPEPLIGAQRIVLRLGDQRVDLATDGLGPFTIVSGGPP
ncbi:prepilin-type N-terminal cleavage/methylation domain-containing protein [Aquincola sp. MAHUQ-54]|uniref:Prepilin-type N-terminal cleavage/methylation domain-containing protein n=1 Tax=Aquincola agrisoli TaxID=3119538 RepID=A0AAW9Q9A4_9BURK